jgi:hypothetical protein
MATVDAIVDEAQLWGFSHVSDANMVSFLNAVYFRVINRYAWPFLEKTNVAITVSSGVGDVPGDCLAVLGVWDTANDLLLIEETEREYLERVIIAGGDDATGVSTHYRVSGGLPGGKITIWRSNSTALRLSYISQPAALAASGAESTIILPPEWHDLLVTGLVAKGYLLEEKFQEAQAMRAVHEADIQMMEKALLHKVVEDDDSYRVEAAGREPRLGQLPTE